MYAVVEIKGKQYKAQEGDLLKVDRLEGADGDRLEFDSVLMLRSDRDKVTVGAPYVNGAKVKAVVEEHGRDRKIIVYKYKRRKGYRRRQGHRRQYSLLRVKEIASAT
ncbi:MAG: 50S ribosomal protein L21 [Spirochaetaceae bacterium]